MCCWVPLSVEEGGTTDVAGTILVVNARGCRGGGAEMGQDGQDGQDDFCRRSY